MQRQLGGVTRDLGGDYLGAPGEADIMCATHFPSLAKMHARVTGGRCAAATLSTAAFMARHAPPGATRAESGFEPLLEDFANTLVLLTPSDCADASWEEEPRATGSHG